MPKIKQGHVLHDLISKHNVKKFAEIGVWKSHTVKIILENKPTSLEEYWAVDPWLKLIDPKYGHYHIRTQREWDKFHLECCKKMLKFPSLRVLRTDHEQASRIFPKQYFDLVFLDADHFFHPTLSQIDHWLPLVKAGGLLTGHGFMKRRPEVEQAVRMQFGDDFELLKATVWLYRQQEKTR